MFITSKLKDLTDELYSFHEFLFNTIEILQKSTNLPALDTLDIYQISESSLLADDVNRFNEIIQMVRCGELHPRIAKDEFKKVDSEICKLYNQMLIIQWLQEKPLHMEGLFIMWEISFKISETKSYAALDCAIAKQSVCVANPLLLSIFIYVNKFCIVSKP